MNKYYFIFLVWLLPAYFLFQGGYQVLIYYGIEETYENGDSYVADVLEFDVKQIAAQTNGYVVLEFTTQSGETVTDQLALPVQMAQVIMESEQIPIRYKANSFKPIVMLTVMELQKSVLLVNIAVSSLGLLVTLLVAFYASRYALKQVRDGEQTLEIERLDTVNA